MRHLAVAGTLFVGVMLAAVPPAHGAWDPSTPAAARNGSTGTPAPVSADLALSGDLQAVPNLPASTVMAASTAPVLDSPLPVFSSETRQRLIDVAQDSVLAPWQREFMIRIAHGGRAEAAGDERADSNRTTSPDGVPSVDGSWVQEPPPNARYLHTVVYDPVRDRMVVFGGYTKVRDLVNEVWVLSLSGSPPWTQLAPAGTPPSGRNLHTAIYDPVRDRLVIFGGLERTDVGYLNDVWVLSLGPSPMWTRLTPAGSPPSTRAYHSAIYDPLRDRMIVFGGYHSGYRGAGAGPLNDVWALSLSEAPAWTQLLPTGTPPSARYGHSAIYDPTHDRMMVFAGYSGGMLNDLWSLSLTGGPSWKTLTHAGTPPDPREEHSATYDPVGERMVIFGGTNGTTTIGDAWSLALTRDHRWSRLTPAGSPPSNRSGHTAVYDPLRQRMVIYGGTSDGFGLLMDVWGLSLSGATTSTDLTPAGTPPSPRRSPSAIYDPVRDRMVVFGGYGNTPGALADVWALSLSGTPVWTQLHPSGIPPSARLEHTAIYDAGNDRMVVFGGSTVQAYLNDVWALTLAGDPAWTRLTPTGEQPDVRAGHSAIYDAGRDRMVVFGGVNSLVYLGDVWALSLAGDPVWTRLAPTGTAPDARGSHSAIYDPGRDRMIVFGGLDGRRFLGDLWVLSLGTAPTWTGVTPTGTPPQVREGHSAIYDPIRDRMVVFGGSGLSSVNDAWSLSLAGGLAWTLLSPAGTTPTARCLHAAVYDPARDRMVVFGGYPDSNDGWELSWSPGTALDVPRSDGGAALSPLFAFPNPSRGDITISFRLAQRSETSLRIYDVAGRVVRTLASGALSAGSQSVRWDRRMETGALVQPGLYFCELRASDYRSVRRIVLVR